MLKQALYALSRCNCTHFCCRPWTALVVWHGPYCQLASLLLPWVLPGSWDSLEAQWDGNLLLVSTSDASTMPAIQLASLWNSLIGHCRCSLDLWCLSIAEHNLTQTRQSTSSCTLPMTQVSLICAGFLKHTWRQKVCDLLSMS